MIKIKNIEEFKEKIINNNKSNKVLVEFYGIGCSKCKSLEFKLNELDLDIPIYKIETYSNPELARKYNIEFIPFLILFEKGKEIARQDKSAINFIKNNLE